MNRDELLLRTLVGDIHPEDGVAPPRRERRRNGRHIKPRKMMGLCRQARDAIALSLPPALELELVSVQPDDDPSRLLVDFRPAHQWVDLEQARSRLSQLKGILRQAVAREITRKRCPDLVLRLLELKASPPAHRAR